MSIDDDIIVNEYLNMKENAIHFINTYIAKNFDDGFCLVLLLITRIIYGMWNIMMEMKRTQS